MVFPDTDVWIRWLGARAGPTAGGGGARPRVFLTTIALQELWAGAAPASRHARDLEALYRLAARRRRIVNPPAAAWVVSGRALRQLTHTRHFGGARMRRLRNDTLLAATALVYGASVLTYNQADFAAIAGVLPVRYLAPGEGL